MSTVRTDKLTLGTLVWVGRRGNVLRTVAAIEQTGAFTVCGEAAYVIRYVEPPDVDWPYAANAALGDDDWSTAGAQQSLFESV